MSLVVSSDKPFPSWVQSPKVNSHKLQVSPPSFTNSESHPLAVAGSNKACSGFALQAGKIGLSCTIRKPLTQTVRWLTLNNNVPYKLYHGDCVDIMPTLAADSVQAIVTDPPYCSGGRQQDSARNIISKSDTREPDEWFLADNMGTDTYIRWMRIIAKECLRVSTMGAHGYVFTDWRQYTNIVTSWESIGWTLRNVIVWDKAFGGAMGSFWRNNHEWVCVFAKGAPSSLPDGYFYNTWRGAKPQGGHHPTEKPIKFLEYIVRAVDGIVLDPFMGSGTTGVACAKLERGFIGIERDAQYFDIAKGRIASAYGEHHESNLPLFASQ